MANPDDQRLLGGLRRGSPKAWPEFVLAHYQRIYRFLIHLTRDVHEAEDLTQETFAAAWEKIAAFRGGATLATWLHRIAYTRFIDARRAKQRAARLLERLPGAEGPSDPLEIMTADDEAQRLYRVLHRLDVPTRTLLVLHYFQGLSYPEMADVLEEPTGTVKWRTSEALTRLRALLNDKVSDHVPRRIPESGRIS